MGNPRVLAGVIFILNGLVVSVFSAIPLTGPQCGQFTCKFLDYCHDKQCVSCAEICSETSHNLDVDKCTRNCQDYLRDARYLGANSAAVQNLTKYIAVTLTLVCFILVVLASLLCFQLYRWKKKKNITLQSIKNKILGRKTDVSSTPDTKNNGAKHETKRPDLRLQMDSRTVESNSNPSPGTLTTTANSRKPAEDSALDYAYDNPAMVSTPSPR